MSRGEDDVGKQKRKSAFGWTHDTEPLNPNAAQQYLHSEDIVHRDLKPENILITPHESDSTLDFLRICDLGLAERAHEPLTYVCGTPTYTAPEIITKPPPGYGTQVDMWATGVIAFIILCGYPPFSSGRRRNVDVLYEQIRTHHLSFDEPEWKSICRRECNGCAWTQCFLTQQ
eukprot:m.259046 g.259046  ORF g.259046 m.259046 type:complete len:173 (-) comp11039_c2_seq5:5319-5837(-)